MNTKKYNLENTIFAWSNQKGLDPIHVIKAEGVHLFDEKNKKYIDFSSQLMNVNIGHGRQEVTDAVKEQMEKLSYVSPPFTVIFQPFATKIRAFSFASSEGTSFILLLF